MLLERSRQSAAPTERPRLAPPWALGLLGAFIGGVLVMIFPQNDLLKRIETAAPDALTLRYMANILRAEPDHHAIRLRLAALQIRRGKTEEARQTAAPLLHAEDAALRNEAAWLIWRALEADFIALSANDPRRAELADGLRRAMRELDLASLPPERVARIIDVASELGDHALAYELMQRAAKHTHLAAEWFAARARAALGRGDYRRAAELYLLARARAETLPARRRWFIEALRTLQSGNLLDEALAMAEQEIGELSHDRDTLLFLAKLARAAQNPAAAERYARRLLQLALLRSMQQIAALPLLRPVAYEPAPGAPGIPFDRDAYRIGYLIFIENGKQEAAYRVAASAVRQRPNNLVWRERLAQVSEWTNRPAEALEQWLWLARNTERADAWAHVRRLASMLNDIGVQNELLRRDAVRGTPDAAYAASLALASSLETEGKPGEALAVIDGLLLKPATPERRLALRRLRLALLDRMGQPFEALAESTRLINEPGATLTDRLEHAERLATMDQREEALALLMQLEADDPQAFATADAEVWRFYAELAAQLDRSDLTERIYRRLAARSDATDADREAAYWALRDTAPDTAFELARAAWQESRQSADFLRALETALAARRVPEGIALLDALSADEWQRLSAEPAVPGLASRLLLAGGRRDTAIAVLRDALQRAPDNAPLAETLLWIAIEIASDLPVRVDAELARPERELLIRLLSAYEARWAQQPALHDALATAWLVLEEPERALHRYLRPQLERRYRNADWRKNYTTLVGQLEREEDRQRIGPASRMAGLSLADRKRGPLAEREALLIARQSLPTAWVPGTFLGAEWAERRFGVKDASQLGSTPDGERELALTLGVDDDVSGRRTTLSLLRHQSDRSSTGWRITHRRPLEAHLRLEAELARDERSVESLPLLLAGRQHRAQVAVAWDATARDSLVATVRNDRYRIEAGPALGSSARLQLDATHRILAGGAFDLSAGAFASTVRTQTRAVALNDPALIGLQPGDPFANSAPGADFFVPPGFQLKGLRLSSGTDYSDFRSAFTRTPRPFFNLSRSWHSLYGPADEFEFGLASSLIGHDHLRFGYTHSKNVRGSADTFREITLSYRLHY